MSSLKGMHQLNQIKNLVLIYTFILAIFSLILKSLNHVDINLMTSMTEIYIILTSLLFQIIIHCKLIGIHIKDDLVKKEQNIWVHIGFQIIIWGGLGFHYVSLLLNDFHIVAQDETFVTLLMLVAFIIAEIYIRKLHSYINYKHIEKPKKAYYASMMTIVGKFWLIALSYAVFIYSLSLSIQQSFAEVKEAWIAIIITFIGVSFQYIVLSVYEKIDYEEDKRIKAGVLPYFLTQKVMLLGIVVIGFQILREFIYTLRYVFSFENAYRLVDQFDLLIERIRIWQFDFALITLIVLVIVYNYLKKTPFQRPKYYPVLLGIILLNFIYSITLTAFEVFRDFFNDLSSFDALMTQLTFMFYIVNFGGILLIYSYFKDNQYPARKSVLFMWFLPILLMIYLSFIFNYDGVDVLVQIRYHLVHLINISLMGALLCYSLSHMCTETLVQPLTKMNNKEEGSK